MIFSVGDLFLEIAKVYGLELPPGEVEKLSDGGAFRDFTLEAFGEACLADVTREGVTFHSYLEEPLDSEYSD